MKIRWGVSPIAWANDDMPELGGAITLDELLTDAREIGFDGVELGNKFPRDAATLAPIMRRHELALIGGWYSSSLLVHDGDAEIAALQDHLALLRALGSDVFILAETSNAVYNDRGSRLDSPPKLEEAGWQTFGARLNTVARYLAMMGMRTAYHYHLGTVVETADDLRHFLAATDDAVGLVVDTGHALYGGIDPLVLVEQHPVRVVHVHCKDIRRDVHADMVAGRRSFLDGVVGGMFTAPGDGDYDFAPFLRALVGIGYCGWVVIEAEQDPGVADPHVYQKLGLDTLKRFATQEGLA